MIIHLTSREVTEALTKEISKKTKIPKEQLHLMEVWGNQGEALDFDIESVSFNIMQPKEEVENVN